MATVNRIGNVSSVADYFVGLGDHIIADAVSDYATAAIGDFTNLKSLGNILDGSTSYTGEAVSTTEWTNEQGIAVTTVTSGGSISYEFSCQDFTSEMATLLLGAESIAVTGVPYATTATAAYGFGHKSNVITRPLIFLDETKTHFLIIPKAKISASLGMDGKNHVIQCVVTAEKLDTANLKTVMWVAAAAVYTS
jgi:hypothetical protein